MPAPRGGAIGEPWHECLEMLERRELDIAMLPLPAVSPRFEARRLYDEEFVLAMRKGHAFARAPTPAAFSQSQHLLVSSAVSRAASSMRCWQSAVSSAALP